jgi:hypothetical protein
VSKLKQFLRVAAILILAIVALGLYLVRGGFRRFEMTPYPAPPAAFTNWNDALAHPREISLERVKKVRKQDAGHLFWDAV